MREICVCVRERGNFEGKDCEVVLAKPGLRKFGRGQES